MTVWTKDALKQWLKDVDGNNPEHVKAVGRALLWMYARQTADEQSSGFTSHNNGVGFSGADAEFMSSVAQRYQRYGRMTEKQCKAVARCLSRYSGQLLQFVNEKASAATVSGSSVTLQPGSVEALRQSSFNTAHINL